MDAPRRRRAAPARVGSRCARQALPQRRRAQDRSRTTPRPTTRSRRASSGLKPHEDYFYRFETQRPQSPVGRFQTALPADSQRAGALRVLLLPGLHARLLQRLRRAGRARTSTSSSASATTSTPRPTTRTARTGVRDDDRRRTRARRSCARRSPTTATSTRSTAPTRRCGVHAQFPIVIALGRPRGRRTTTRAALPGGGLPPADALQRRAPQAPRLPGVLRGDAALPSTARDRHLPHAALRPQRRPDHARPAPVPRRPAVRRRRARQPCADDTTSRARSSARQQMAWCKRALSALEGLLEGRSANEVMVMPPKVAGRTRLTFDTWQGYRSEREELLASRQGQRSRTSSSSPATSTRSSPATCRDGRERRPAGRAPSSSAARSRRTASARPPRRGRRHHDQGHARNPGTPPTSSSAAGDQPVGIDTDTAHHGYAVAKFAAATRSPCDYVRMSTTRTKGAGAIDPLKYVVPRGERKPQKL